MFKNEGEVYAVLNNGNIAIWTKTTFLNHFWVDIEEYLT